MVSNGKKQKQRIPFTAGQPGRVQATHTKPMFLAKRQTVKAGMLDLGESAFMDRHFAYTTTTQADVAINKGARERVRVRARYEVANNSYLKGMVETLVNDIVGTGPRLQILDRQDEKLNRMIEADFAAWMKATSFVQKYQTSKRSQKIDGEIFFVMTTNPKVAHDVKMDVMLVEADQVDTPMQVTGLNNGIVDGIKFDEYGNPERYWVKRRRAGKLNLSLKYDEYAASSVIHRFRADRPGQHHGYSELTAALPLGAHLRAFTLATVKAARSAANYSWILGTTGEGGENPTGVAWDEIDLEMGMGMVAPDGYKPYQIGCRTSFNYISAVQG